MKRDNQHLRILKVLWAGRSLTPLQAVRLGTLKLSTRCGELRELNYTIKCKWQFGNGKRWKVHYMPEFYKGRPL